MQSSIAGWRGFCFLGPRMSRVSVGRKLKVVALGRFQQTYFDYPPCHGLYIIIFDFYKQDVEPWFQSNELTNPRHDSLKPGPLMKLLQYLSKALNFTHELVCESEGGVPLSVSPYSASNLHITNLSFSHY